MRVFAGSLSTETNTFSPTPTGMADFDIVRAADVTPEMLEEEDIMNVLRRKCEERGWEFIFSLAAGAQPAGKTVRWVYESLRDELLDALKAAMPVDLVFLPLHGSMIAEGYDDCESDIIHRVREIVGPDAKIGVELDPHCDVTESMMAEADAIILMKEYPHTDGLARAEELFRMIVDAYEGRIKPVMALYDCRMINFYLTPVEPMRSYVDAMMAAEGKDGVLSISLVHCFPWADVPTTGTKVLVITDNDKAKAEQVAAEFGRKLFDIRHSVGVHSPPMDEAFDKALAAKGMPVVIADQADNPGGGAPSDSTFALREMLRRGIDNSGVAMLWDPIAVQVAMAAGAGAKLDLRVGGKMGPVSGDPLDLSVTVVGVVEDMHQELDFEGRKFRVPCGDSVALNCNGIDIIVNSKRTQVLSPTVFSNFGIDPTRRRILVVKSTQHFYAAFSKIAAEIIYMSAPGAIAPKFTDIPYQRVDLNKYPWVDDPFASG